MIYLLSLLNFNLNCCRPTHIHQTPKRHFRVYTNPTRSRRRTQRRSTAPADRLLRTDTARHGANTSARRYTECRHLAWNCWSPWQRGRRGRWSI